MVFAIVKLEAVGWLGLCRLRVTKRKKGLINIKKR